MSLDDESEVCFFYEEIDFSLANEPQFVSWIRKIISSEKASLENLNYIFCSDEYLLKINKEYLSHDYYTDIISFPYKEFPEPIQGDIFISIDRVKENAIDNLVSFDDELIRVMAHGLMHFMGYKDKSPADSTVMRQKENEMMALYKV
jgi:rRNA maturation RNase YbeY